MEGTIVNELKAFFLNTRITVAELSRISGVPQMQISLLRRGKRRDCLSETATKLRNGMKELYSVWEERVAQHGMAVK